LLVGKPTFRHTGGTQREKKAPGFTAGTRNRGVRLHISNVTEKNLSGIKVKGGTKQGTGGLVLVKGPMLDGKKVRSSVRGSRLGRNV